MRVDYRLFVVVYVRLPVRPGGDGGTAWDGTSSFPLTTRHSLITLGYMKLIMDSDCLIKLTKAGLKETVCRHFNVDIPALVKHEIVDSGGSHGDAEIIAANIKRDLIKVQVDKRHYEKGEDAALTAFTEGKYDAICSDDRKFLKVLQAVGAPHATPAVLLCLLAMQKHISAAEGRKHLEKLKAYISGDEYAVARLKLESD